MIASIICFTWKVKLDVDEPSFPFVGLQRFLAVGAPDVWVLGLNHGHETIISNDMTTSNWFVARFSVAHNTHVTVSTVSHNLSEKLFKLYELINDTINN